MPTNLYRFQTDVVDRAVSEFAKMRAELRRSGDSSALLICMPCGMGKTVVLASFIERALHNSVTLVLTPGKGNLAAQTHAVLSRELASTGVPVLLIGEDTPPPAAPSPGTVIVTNYEKVVVKDRASGAYKSRISRDGENTTLWDTIAHLRGTGTELVVAIDEAHYGSHGSRGRIGEFFAEVSARYGSTPLRVETTATPTATTRSVEVYVVEAKAHEGVSAGLLREKVVLNFSRDETETAVRADLAAGSHPEWANSEDAVLAEMMWRRWSEVVSMIDSGDVQDAYLPLMLFCVSNGKDGEREMALIEAFLADKGITRANGKLAVHLTDDALSFAEQRSLTRPQSPVCALIFKQSIALGWDCPRAQFMLLTRKVSENATTFTDQLLGRIRRQVYGRSRGVPAIDTAYLYSMCDAGVVARQSGVPVESDETASRADPSQLKQWERAGMRRSTIIRKGRNTARRDADGKALDPLNRADILDILKGVAPAGPLRGDPANYTVKMAGEQELSTGSEIVTRLGVSHVYGSVLREKVTDAIIAALTDEGVFGRRRLAAAALEPVVMWFRENYPSADVRAEEALLADLETAGYGGVAFTTLAALAREVKAREGGTRRNSYVESPYSPYVPAPSRNRPTDDAARRDPFLRLKSYDGPIADKSLYGAVTRSSNTRTEDMFEDEFIAHAAKSPALVSWLRNDLRLDSYGTAFSLGYRKGRESATEQMFPDYLLLFRNADGKLAPVVIEVKGSDNGRPVDGSSDGSIDAKAARLAELSSDDVGYGLRHDTGSGEDVVYGRGPTIGALVFKDRGAWRVYGQGAITELGTWLRGHGIAV